MTTTPLPNLPGHFYYADLHTSDVDAATAFYGSLLGWEFEEIPGAPNRYVPAMLDGRGVSAIGGLSPEQVAAGTPSHWISYVWVDDIEATVARAVELGATVRDEVIDVFDMGRMAVIEDPTGAALGLWQDAQPGATTVKDLHGAPFWFELHTSDLEAARAFYSQLLGWSIDELPMGDTAGFSYNIITPAQTDEQQQAAGAIMSQMQADRDAGHPSTWHVYLNVDDCDTAHARALELGGDSLMEPHDIPTAGRSCWLNDPTGAPFAAMKPDPRQR